MKDLTFGIEIESTGIARRTAAKVIAKVSLEQRQDMWVEVMMSGKSKIQTEEFENNE